MSAAISARRSPTCKPTDSSARSRKPATVSSAGASSILRACALAKASVVPSSRLIAGRVDLGDRIACGVAVADQVLEQTRQRCQPPADRRRGGVLGLAHVPFPGDHGLVVGLAQLRRRGDRQRAQKVRDIAPVGAPGAGALLAVRQISSSGMAARQSITVGGVAIGWPVGTTGLVVVMAAVPSR